MKKISLQKNNYIVDRPKTKLCNSKQRAEKAMLTRMNIGKTCSTIETIY